MKSRKIFAKLIDQFQVAEFLDFFRALTRLFNIMVFHSMEELIKPTIPYTVFYDSKKCKTVSWESAVEEDTYISMNRAS